MNFMSNKNFYQRIERMDSKSLSDLKKSLINKNEIRAASSSRAAYFKEPNRCESLESFSNNETFCMPKSTVSNEIYDKLKLPPALPAPPAAAAAAAAATTAPANHNTFVDTSNSNSFVITVITEGRGYAQGEVGIASIDIHSPILLLSQFSDEAWYNGFITKINLLQPNEIIIPYTIYNTNSKIVNTIKENFSNIKLIPLPRRHFNTEDGLIMINELCSNDCKTLIKFIEKRYYTVAAASALLKYLKQIRLINFIRGGLKIEYQAKCGRMLIDHDTCHRLELLYPNCQTKQKTSCLFGILDHTVTVIGKRQLRAKILEPFFDLSKILLIQDTIKELINDPELLLILEDKLQKFWNIDKVLKIVIIESQDNKTKSVELMFDKILLLKSMLEQIPELADCLRQCKSTIFKESYNILMDERYSVMLTTINDVIRPEVQFCRGINQYFNRIQAIQDDVDQMLDFSRSMYTKLTDMIRDMIKELSIEHKLQLRMMYMTTKGFYIQLTLPKNNPDIRLPSNMTVFHRKGNVLHITTPELIKLNVRITEVVNEIYEISDKILRELICKITQYIDANHYLIGIVSNLDIFQSYAKVSLNDEFCCPDFGEETKINDAVHPLLEYSRTKSRIVRNNIIATPEYNMFIITGPNMGGKTVYIKMIATLQILAQLGCFVPARRAKFKLCDRIFTRIGYEDTTDQNGSSFEIELREIEYIFKNITPNSLVIVDELCRSTNPSDGKKIAKRICEKFSTLKGYKSYEESETNDNMETKSNNPLKSTTLPSQSPSSSSLLCAGDNHNDKIENLTAPFIYITTHFIHLTRLSDKFLNVINLHVEAKEKFINGILNLEYTHKVKEGVTPIKGYGISLAHSVQLNESIISRAYEILNNYSEIPNENVLPSVDSSSSFFIEPIFTNLERTLNQSSTTYLLDNNVNVSVISNFMNETNNKSQDQFLQDQNETNNLQNLSTRQLLEDVQRKFYDIYAELAEIYRSNKISSIEINSQINDDDDGNDNDDDEMMLINQKITEIMDSLIKNLPKPLLFEIRKNKKNQNERDPRLFERSATKETDNGMSKNATDATVNTTANSTGSAVTTAAIYTVATGTCATTSVSTVIATTTSTAVTTTTAVNTTTAATTSDDSNVDWSKLYPDMSFHSFMRKLANGEISIPQISLNKQNPDNLQQKPNTSSSSAPSTPLVHLKSPPSFSSRESLPKIEILDNRIINPTEVIENDNTATIPQISLNKQNRDNLQQKPSTSSLAPLVFSKSLLSSSSRKILDSRLINQTESIANGNTITIPQISFNQRNLDSLQQEPSTSSSSSTSAPLAHLPLISSSSSKFPDNRIINPTEIIQPIDLRALPSNHDHRQVTIIDHNIQEGALDLSKSKRDDSKSFEENNKNNEKFEQPKEEQPKEEQPIKLRRQRRSRRK